MAEQKSIVFACIVNHTLGGRVFVEAGAKGDLDRPITGFISGVVNKRAEPKGSFNQGSNCFSYMKGANGTYSFVAVAPTDLDTEVIAEFLQALSEQVAGKEDKTAVQEDLNQVLAKYQAIGNKDQLKELKDKEEAAKAASVAPADVTNPFIPVENFFKSVIDKSQHRDPDRDPFTHFIMAVEDSYKEQGGNEAVVKVFKDVEELTKKQIHKIEEDISKQGVANYGKTVIHDIEQKGMEVGGSILDAYEQLDKDVQKSGGYQEYLKKEIAVIEQTVAPVAAQAGAIVIETGSQAGGLLMDKIDQIGKDVEKKGGFEPYLKAEAELTLAKSMELGSALAAGAAEFNQEVQQKGFQVALLSAFENLGKAFAAKKEEAKSSSESGFDEESF